MPPSTPPPLAQILGGGGLLTTVSRALTTTADALLAPHGVTSQQAAVLMLTGPDGATPVELRPRLGVDAAAMTRLVDRLGAKGLLERRAHPSDRRSITLHLTPAGNRVRRHLPRIFGQVSSRALAGLSEAQLDQLVTTLGQVADNLTRDPAAG